MDPPRASRTLAPREPGAIWLGPGRSGGMTDYRTLLRRTLFVVLLVAVLTVIGTLAFL